MKTFLFCDEVDDWLRPMTYEEFWRETEPFVLDTPTRAECDSDIAEGANPVTVLAVLKRLARLQIISDLDLPYRDISPDRSFSRH